MSNADHITIAIQCGSFMLLIMSMIAVAHACLKVLRPVTFEQEPPAPKPRTILPPTALRTPIAHIGNLGRVLTPAERALHDWVHAKFKAYQWPVLYFTGKEVKAGVELLTGVRMPHGDLRRMLAAMPCEQVFGPVFRVHPAAKRAASCWRIEGMGNLVRMRAYVFDIRHWGRPEWHNNIDANATIEWMLLCETYGLRIPPVHGSVAPAQAASARLAHMKLTTFVPPQAAPGGTGPNQPTPQCHGKEGTEAGGPQEGRREEGGAPQAGPQSSPAQAGAEGGTEEGRQEEGGAQEGRQAQGGEAREADRHQQPGR